MELFQGKIPWTRCFLDKKDVNTASWVKLKVKILCPCKMCVKFHFGPIYIKKEAFPSLCIYLFVNKYFQIRMRPSFSCSTFRRGGLYTLFN